MQPSQGVGCGTTQLLHVEPAHLFGDEYDDARSEIGHERDEPQAQEGGPREANRKIKFVSKLRYCRAWEEFLDIFKMVGKPHYCDSLPNLLELERSAHRVLMLQTLMLQTLPTKITKDMWTTRGPCLDSWLVSFTKNMIFKVWTIAYAKLAVQHRQRQPRGVQHATAPDIVQKIH